MNSSDLINYSQAALAQTTTVAAKIQEGRIKPSDAEIATLAANFSQIATEAGNLAKQLAGKPATPPALTGKTKAELVDIARDEHVDIDEGSTNADIVSAIEASRAV